MMVVVRLWWCVLAILLLGGCENWITVRAKVTVPAELTQDFSEERPGIVTIDADIPKTSVMGRVLAVLCAPEEEDLVLDWEYDGFGCAKEGIVTARLEEADGAEVTHPCGVVESNLHPSGLHSAVLVARASEVVFEGNSKPSGCTSDSDSVELVLAPPEQ